jgi:pyruvate-ferredoxin/flavodoxin oxidoreductase
MKGKAITMESSSELKEIELKNQKYAYTLPQRQPFEPNTVKGLQFSKPYFEYSGACAGCGETPYIKMLTQLFGDRMLIANATGCSSIYGGTFPSCPYTTDSLNLGPAWANSLFEDNAEFGYGIMLASKEKRTNFINTLKQTKFSNNIQNFVNQFLQDTDNHKQNRELLQQLNLYFATRGVEDCDKYLYQNLGQIIKPSTWIIGGDGWAYDIGFGGLDHVIASGENINILVLDTEIYSNTGGQTSKSTPRGASAKFNQTGKTTKK